MIEKLPIHEVLGELLATLQHRDEALLHAPPGAGKTTMVPLEFLNQIEKKVLLLEPRRIAARNAAARLADLLGEEVGQTVGYRMRLDTRVSAKTRLEVVTEGVLLRMLQEDPALSSFDLVIFDEFHERSLDADLGLTLMLKSREIFRERPLKLLVMSATLEDARISEFLKNAPVVRSDGEAFPVEINYCGAAKPRERIVDRAEEIIHRVIAKHPSSSLLVFLPGEGEIRQLESRLRERAPGNFTVCPLYGNLDLNTQRQAVAATRPGYNKIVLATNIAESSLTIDGINIVIDSGLERRGRFDPNTAMTRLETGRISQYSATQRAGRAGRTAPGHCYRLWSEEQQQQLALSIRPEILDADLAQLSLQLLDWGISSPHEVDWLDPPPTAHWQQAVDTLAACGAVEVLQNGSLRLTQHGEQMARLPLAPRISHMLLWAARLDALDMGVTLAAIWSERDPFGRDPGIGADLESRVEIALGLGPCPNQYRGWLKRCQRQRDQLLQQTKQFGKPETLEAINDQDKLACLVALAYPDRIARKRHGGAYQLANGRSAKLPQERKAAYKWLAVAEVTGSAKGTDTIRTAQPLNPDLLQNQLSSLVTESRVVEWDKQQSRFIAEAQTRLGHLVINRQALPDVEPEERAQAICEFIAQQGLQVFKSYSSFRTFQCRCLTMYRYHQDPVYDLSDNKLLSTLEEWLAPYLMQVSRLDEIQKLDITTICRDRLNHSQQTGLDRFLPTTIEVPSGSRLKIDYSVEPPVLSVKLQEMFGCDDTPAVANGEVKLMVHLLSPAGRPLQITQDLRGFWRSGYEAVRKEMRGRYPKHPWPEDPTTAIASRGTKSRGVNSTKN